MLPLLVRDWFVAEDHLGRRRDKKSPAAWRLERALTSKESDDGGPESGGAFREGRAKCWQGCVWAGLLSREIPEFRVLNALQWWKGKTACRRLREPLGGVPRGSENPVHARDLSMRENREIRGRPRVVMRRAGRAGRLGR